MKIVDCSGPWLREDNEYLMAGSHTLTNADIPTAGTSLNESKKHCPPA